MRLPEGFVLDSKNDSNSNLPEGFVLDEIEDKPKKWTGHETKRFIRPLGRAIKKEGLSSVRHIPAAAVSFLEDIGGGTDILSARIRPGEPTIKTLTDLIVGEQEGLTEEEKGATYAAREVLKSLIPIIPSEMKLLEKSKIPLSKIKPPKPTKPPKEPFLSSSEFAEKKGLIPDLIDLFVNEKRFPTSEISESLEPAFAKLQKEVSPISKIKTKISPELIKEKLPKFPQETKPLTKKITFEEKPLSNVITKESYKGALPEAETTSDIIKKSSKETRKPFEKAYKKAEEIYKNQSLTVKEQGNLIEKTDQIIDQLELIQKRNPGEEVVYQHAKAIKSMIGSHKGHIVPENQLSRLIKQSDSMSAVANYDMPYIGYKGVLKKMSKNLNESVINSLNQQGLNSEPFIKADKLYSNWAETYLNEEISPFLEKRIANPEKLYKNVIKDSGTYRSVEKILKNKDPALLKRYNKSIVTNNLDQYVKKPELIGKQQYNSDIIDLRNIIGTEDTLKADKYLKGLKRQSEITERIPKLKPKEIVESAKLRTLTEKPKFKYKNLTEMRKEFKTREGIKDLRSELKRVKQDKFFNKLSEQQMDDMFRKGKVVGKKMKGNDLVDLLSKRDNYEVFSELLGENTVKKLIQEAQIQGRKDLTASIAKNIVKSVGKTYLGGKFLKILIGHIPA